MSAPVFVVPSERLVPGRVVVDGPEGRHAATVLRLRVGEPVVLVDGAGRRGAGTVAAVLAKDAVEVAVPAVDDEAAPAPRLVVVQALPKGDRGETAIETMTEVGVDEVVPWAAARCVTRWREGRGDKALDRWRTTAQAAGKQSRRSRFPVVADLASTRDVVDRLRAAAAGVLLHEECRRPTARWSAWWGPRAGSAPRSWPPSPRPAPRRTGWARRCCAPRRPGPPRWPSCWPVPGAGGDRRLPDGEGLGVDVDR